MDQTFVSGLGNIYVNEALFMTKINPLKACCNLDTKDINQLIKNIKTNTLIITGSDDPGSTPDMSKNLNKDIQNSTYVEIKNGKHLCTIEYADEVNNAIMKHINNA